MQNAANTDLTVNKIKICHMLLQIDMTSWVIRKPLFPWFIIVILHPPLQLHNMIRLVMFAVCLRTVLSIIIDIKPTPF